MNPYLVLGVPPHADDQTIRQAYLTGIRRATPESDPQRFQALTRAYDQVKDAASRCRYELFDLTSPGDSPMAVFLNAARNRPCAAPLSFEAMKNHLRSCAKL